MKRKRFSKKLFVYIFLLCYCFLNVFDAYAVPVYASSANPPWNIRNEPPGSLGSYYPDKDLGNLREDGLLGVMKNTATYYTDYYSAPYRHLQDTIAYVFKTDQNWFNTFVLGTGSLVSAGGAGQVNRGLNAYANYYSNASVGNTSTGATVTRPDGSTYNPKYNFYSNSGNSTSYNNTTYNQTDNHSIVTTNKTYNTTTNNYDYSYKVYNPVTNNYFTTNNYSYSQTYNTYNFVTNYVTNNYNYTTNYYIQDNRTYISYYIVNTNTDTGEVEEETYQELFYKLPDGRNSFNLKVSEIKGVYFPTDYSKYVSVAEDDGTTLGLWHLDGDLKDSSYWGNTAGSAYNNIYTDGYWSDTLGKKFSENESDFLELKLDKVDLPDSWTLEWYEYVPDSSSFTSSKLDRTDHVDHSSSKQGNYDIFGFKYYLNNYISLSGTSNFYAVSGGAFVPYALVKTSSGYHFYINGVLNGSIVFNNDNYSKCSINGSGVSVSSSSIRFDVEKNKQVGYYMDSSWYLYLSDSYNNYYRKYEYIYYLSSHVNSVIDEVRLSSGALYSGDSYVPSAQPFTTNTVLAVPENPKNNEISFMTNYDIGSVRFGGVRPTYPANGAIYVHLDDDEKVDSIQQYQEDGWYSITASVYFDNEWQLLEGFNMANMSFYSEGDDETKDPDYPGNTPATPSNPSTPSNPDIPGFGDGDSSGFWASLGKLLASFVNGIATLLKPLIDGIASLIDGILGALTSIASLINGSFAGFLAEAFQFIPQDIVNVVVLGISLIILVSIIKIFRG